jgi:hypothetical protein
MLILGLLVLGCTAAFTGLAIADNLGGGPEYDVTMLGHHIATMNSLAIFCAGLALALIFGLAALMTIGGMSLRHRKSRKLAEARREAREAARERDELAARLEHTPAAGEPALATSDDGGYPTTRERDLSADRTADLGGDRDFENAGTARADTTDLPQRKHARHLFGH